MAFHRPDLFKNLVWPESLFTGLLIIKVIKNYILSTSKIGLIV